MLVVSVPMQVVSTSALRVGSLVWQPWPRVWALSVICKATFLLAPGTSQLADVQDELFDDDGYWDDDPQRSLYAPSDLVPVKPRADVLLVGHAFAPGGRPVRSLVARFVVGELVGEPWLALLSVPFRFGKPSLRWVQDEPPLEFSPAYETNPSITLGLAE